MFLYDPLTMIALFVAYIVGFIVLQLIAMKIAPRVASSLSGRFSLYSAMALTALIIVVGGGIAIYLIYMATLNLGYSLSLGYLVVFIIVINIITYVLSPWMINLMYGARPDPELQRLVDEAARRAGLSNPPKAVVVEGPPNAFAYGNFLSGKYVAVSTEMLRITDKEELMAVIGHELGHHKHKDTVILLLLGIVPSILYYLGVSLIRIGLWTGGSRDRDREGGGGLYLALLGIAAVILILIIQVIVLAFSRLREYYADAHGAKIAGSRNMQRALAKLHLYYEAYEGPKLQVENSKLRTLFIYALTETLAHPFYVYYEPRRRKRRVSWENIDYVIETLKKKPVDPSQEIFSSHPPIPKRLRFLDKLRLSEINP